MANARLRPDSDVYVFLAGDPNGPPYLSCLECRLGYRDFKAGTTAAMFDHLHEHVTAGHKVPSYTIPDLMEVQVENDAQMHT